MNPLFIPLIIFGYLLVGTIWSGVVTRVLGDNAFLPATLILWPITLPLGLLVALYAQIIGKPVKNAF